MSTSTAPTVRCPACAATVRAGSGWCTLCYADLRPAPAPATSASATPPTTARVAQSGSSQSFADDEIAPLIGGEPVGDRPGGASDSAAVTPQRSRGKHARRDLSYDESSSTPNDVEALASQMVAELAAAESKNPLGPIAGTVDTTAKRAVLMVGGAVVAMLLLFILMAVAGALL